MGHGYQEYSIDFRVLFWLSGNMLQGSSDVALSIHNELKNANIEVAIPKQRMIFDGDKEKIIPKVPTRKVSRKTTPKSSSENKSEP